MVNSTAVGGGVAEILSRMMPLLRELGLDARWHVMEGGADFFDVTKAFHNSLQGGRTNWASAAFEIYRDYNRRNMEKLPLDARFMVMHDPQPAAFIDKKRDGQHWIWRCHIDLSRPDPDVWNFLEPYVIRFEGSIFSSPEYARQLKIPQYLFYPSIDPLADKNRDLEQEYVDGVIERYGIDGKRPSSPRSRDSIAGRIRWAWCVPIAS